MSVIAFPTTKWLPSRCAALLLSLAISSVAFAGDTNAKSDDLTGVSIEALTKISVVSATKREEQLDRTAAAVYVITAAEIRRSGARTVADALRIAPGVEVAQLDSNKWAISIRGFNGRFANKLLVMIDGRSVYNESFSGVYWDLQDLVLEDIDRIEVVRGPGAALWGANAVNGVINIITADSVNTQGALVSVGAGTYDRVATTARYGGTLGNRATYRVFGKFLDRGSRNMIAGVPDTKWRIGSGGFRLDKDYGTKGTVLLEGSALKGKSDSIIQLASLEPPYMISGLLDAERYNAQNLLGRWERKAQSGTKTALQIYFDRYDRHDPMTGPETRNTVDVDFQRALSKRRNNEVTWGVGYRYTTDYVKEQDALALHFSPERGHDHLASAFVQDEIRLLRDRLRVTLGTRVEHNSYTGWEAEPNARFLVPISQRQTWWAAVGRAVRTPSRLERALSDGVFAAPTLYGLPLLIAGMGNPHFGSESVMAYESGYRVQPRQNLSIDLASFYNHYTGIGGIAALDPSFSGNPVLHIEMPYVFVNGMKVNTYGVETAVRWSPNRVWTLDVSHTYLRMKTHTAEHVLPNVQSISESPTHQAKIRSAFKVAPGVEFDTSLNYTSPLRGTTQLDPELVRLASLVGIDATQGGSSGMELFAQSPVPGHLRCDARAAWNPNKTWQFEVVGQDLVSPQRLQVNDTEAVVLGAVSGKSRNVFGKITWRF